jgi:hypothetical protein
LHTDDDGKQLRLFVVHADDFRLWLFVYGTDDFWVRLHFLLGTDDGFYPRHESAHDGPATAPDDTTAACSDEIAWTGIRDL